MTETIISDAGQLSVAVRQQLQYYLLDPAAWSGADLSWTAPPPSPLGLPAR